MVQIAGPEDVAPVHLADNNDGTYDGSYTVHKPGRYHVNITLDEEPIKGSPYAVLIEAARAAESYAEGPGLEVS